MAKEDNPDKKVMYTNIVTKAKAALTTLENVLNGEKVPLEQIDQPKQVSDRRSFWFVYFFSFSHFLVSTLLFMTFWNLSYIDRRFIKKSFYAVGNLRTFCVFKPCYYK